MNTIPVFGNERKLPTPVGGLALGHVDYYPNPKLGVQIRYGTPTNAKADAYLYDMGLPDIPDDLNSPQVMEWFQVACENVSMAAEQGLYRDLEVLASQYLHLPPDAPEPFCLWASFAYCQVPGPDAPVVSYETRRVSNLALRTDRGFINKVRYTYPEEAGEAGFAGFLAFLVEWTDAVQQAPGGPPASA